MSPPVGRAGRTPFYGADLARVHHDGFAALAGAAAGWLLRYLARHRVPDGPILDLGCGSGTFAAGALASGRPVLGIDISPAMVALARGTAPGATFRVGSMHEAAYPPSAIVAIVGEGLGYVSGSGRAPPLSRTFRKVRRCLPAGGLFVFDLVTGPLPLVAPRQGIRTGRDWAVLSSTRALRGGRLAREITTFRRVGRHYRRSDEIHIIRVLERPAVVHALRACGFTVRTTGAYDDTVELPGRTVFVARKRTAAAEPG